MAQKTMPGTPKQRSVSRPAQGVGKRPASAGGRPKSAKPKLAVPSYRAAHSRAGSLDIS